MNDEFDCCEKCDYWEDKIDVYIHNQIKEAKLTKFAEKDSKNTKLLIPNNIKASGGNHKTGGKYVELKDEIHVVGNDKVIAKVGTTSSQ